MSYRNDADGLTKSLGHHHKREKWRLFTDTAKASLKGFLLYVRNEFPSVPVFHATKMKETYEKKKLLLRCIKYYVHCWNMRGDLKVTAVLVGTQLGFTKYGCLLREWDSPAKARHYSDKERPKHEQFQPGQMNVRKEPLVDPKKILLPPLRTKLGMMKNPVKAMVHDGKGFQYLQQKFQQISESKIEERIFLGPKIRIF